MQAWPGHGWLLHYMAPAPTARLGMIDTIPVTAG